ncbi:hypothetical protein [Tenacibaculum sp.]|uniref:hypothetical protein n=1 Tax=Tenacibaculum sp. TaxID=1906242 RepID=UPI003AA981D0
MRNVFHWRMDASMHLDQVLACRKYIIESFEVSSSVSIEFLFQLMPLYYEDLSDVKERGDFELDNNNFQNSGDAFNMELSDPAIGSYFLDVPEVISGKYTKDNISEEFIIEFDSKLELEIPEITELGINRSSFQLLEKVISNLDGTTTILKDTIDSSKFIWIEASLTKGSSNLMGKMGSEGIEKFSSFDSSNIDCGNGDPNEPIWYAVQNLRESKPCKPFCFITTKYESSPHLRYLNHPGVIKREAMAIKKGHCKEC